MRIYVSHSGGMSPADPIGTWFVVEPIHNPEPEVERLLRPIPPHYPNGRTVIALDVEPNKGLGRCEVIDFRDPRDVWTYTERKEGQWFAERGDDRLGPFPSEAEAREYVALPEELKY